MKKVLIVDSDKAISEFLDTVVRSAGYDSIVVEDGAEGIKKFELEKPDLVFMDILLPKIDGFEVLKRIRKYSERTDAPVVMISGGMENRVFEEEALKECGASSYLIKPFTVVDVWRELEAFLGSKAEIEPATDWDEIGWKSFREVPLAAVLADVKKRRADGLLFIRGEGTTLLVMLTGGRIAFVWSNDPDYRLDKILFKKNLIDKARYNQAQELFISSRGRRRMGEILVGMRFLKREELRDALQIQQLALITRAFGWIDANFKFLEGSFPTEEPIYIDIDIDDLIIEGIRLMPDTTPLEKYLPPPASVLKRTKKGENLMGELKLNSWERQILHLIDGKKNLRKIFSIGDLAQVNVATTIFSFLASGMAESLSEGGEEVSKPAREKSYPDFEMQGSLGDLPVPFLLMKIFRSGLTGVLHITRNGVNKWLSIEEGEVVFAGSDEEMDKLGQILLRSGLIKEEHLETALKKMAEDRSKRIGRIFVEMGLLTLEDLHWAVLFQIQAILMDLFKCREGEYLFKEGDTLEKEQITLEIDTPGLILEGTRNIPSSEIASRVRTDVSLRVAEDANELMSMVRLSPQEKEFLDIIDGKKGALELTLPHVREEDGLKSLFTLLSIGIVEYGGKLGERGREESVPSDFELVRPFDPGESGIESVPYFLYQEITKEREELEKGLREMKEKLARAESEIQKLVELLSEFSTTSEGEALPLVRVNDYLSKILSEFRQH